MSRFRLVEARVHVQIQAPKHSTGSVYVRFMSMRSILNCDVDLRAYRMDVQALSEI